MGFKVLAAFFAIYILWGSTYLAIRVAVEHVPPLFAAGVRFLTAGGAVYLWTVVRGTVVRGTVVRGTMVRGQRGPTPRQWRNMAILSALMFLAAYGGLFWAEKTIPSGVASVLVATIPVWTALMQVVVFKEGRFSGSLLAGIALGFLGVLILTLDSSTGSLNLAACLLALSSPICWSLGTVLSKKLEVPESKLTSAGSEMLLGGVMLLACSALAGELRPFPHVSLEAGLAIAYLIVAGSIVAFTAYLFLLGRMPATAVTSYAYVNPVIALAIGWWLGNEHVGVRTLVGAGFILAGVVLLLRRPPVAA